MTVAVAVTTPLNYIIYRILTLLLFWESLHLLQSPKCHVTILTPSINYCCYENIYEMLAARDQENLVHGHQTVAASKPLNQGTRGLQPKTPGNKYPKTPLKIPLNDENAPAGFGGKSGKGKGLENMMTGGKKVATFDKNAFVTPMGMQIHHREIAIY